MYKTLNISIAYLYTQIYYTHVIYTNTDFINTHIISETWKMCSFTTAKLHNIINYKGSSILQQSCAVYRNNSLAEPELVFVEGTSGKEYKAGTYHRNRRFYYRPIGLHLGTEKKMALLLER